MLKALIVEDDFLIAEDIHDCLEELGYKVVDIAYTKEQAIRFLEKYDVDIALLDINLGNKDDGIHIGAHIQERYGIPFVFLTSYSDKTTLEHAKVTQPSGYLLKPFDKKDLFSTLEIAVFNHTKQKGPNEWNIDKINKNIVDQLTPKEFEILMDLRSGLTNQALADKHFVSVNTIKAHLKSIFIKLDVNTRTAAIDQAEKLNH